MIDASIAPVLITLTTLCTVIMIGVGFLPRPSRESVIWSSAFTSAMGASYLAQAAASADVAPLNAMSAGFALLALGLVWVGVRVRAGRTRVFLLPTIAAAIGGTAVLLVLQRSPGVALDVAEAVGVVLAAAALIATSTELVALRGATRVAVLPLAVGAGVSSVFALIWVVTRVLRPTNDTAAVASAVDTIRADLGIMAIIYLVTALVTTLLLCRTEAAPTDTVPGAGFDRVARDRLSRAERAGDAWWSVLEVRLDDPQVLREASSTLAYSRVLERFANDLLDVVPPEADIEMLDPTRALVLLPRHDPAVRPIIRALLDRLTTVDDDQSITVRLSASVGWASVSMFGFALDDLVHAASAAADDAQRAGGDRWDRAIASI